MSMTLLMEQECVPVSLCVGAEVMCRHGNLWLTMEGRRRTASPDIVLEAGQRHRVTEDAIYFLTALGKANVTLCQITCGDVDKTARMRLGWRWGATQHS